MGHDDEYMNGPNSRALETPVYTIGLGSNGETHDSWLWCIGRVHEPQKMLLFFLGDEAEHLIGVELAYKESLVTKLQPRFSLVNPAPGFKIKNVQANPRPLSDYIAGLFHAAGGLDKDEYEGLNASALKSEADMRKLWYRWQKKFWEASVDVFNQWGLVDDAAPAIIRRVLTVG